MIESYFLNLEKTLAEFSNGCCVSITKKIYNSKQGYINGSIIFENNDRLDFVEVVNTDSQNKIKYRYHYMNQNQEMVFRYDNAPHHSEIATFPHHKHEIEAIKPSIEPTLYDVLIEIFQLQRLEHENSK
jgi:hypothetical protein